MLRLCRTLGLLLALGPLLAEGVELVPPLIRLGQAVQPAEPAGDRRLPGRAEPAAPAKAAAYRVAWDDYISVIGIERSGQLRRRAWVATIHAGSGSLAVAYAGTAFVDQRGDIHIDCQQVGIIGPQAAHWSPDSFAIEAEGTVRVIDDLNRGNPGRLTESVVPEADAQGYEQLLALARSYVLARL